MVGLAADLARYLPDEAWFNFRPRGIHGAPHTTRVLIWAAMLVDLLGRRDALRRDELLWAASIHDVGRLDDGVDRGHGTRSAEWALTRLASERPEVSALDIEFIAELCRWHEIPDANIARLSLELVILKDADGLDRVRLGDLDPGRLRLQQATRLIDAASRLEIATNRYGIVTAGEVLEAARAQLG